MGVALGWPATPKLMARNKPCGGFGVALGRLASKGGFVVIFGPAERVIVTKGRAGDTADLPRPKFRLFQEWN